MGGAILWVLPPPARVIEVDSSNRTEAAAPATTLRGAFHVHSRWSDGSGTVDEVAAAAAAADLDFVVLTDHGDATISRPPSYRSGVLVIQGVEIGTDGGHYVALGLPAAPYPLGGDARGVVEDVRRLGGFGVVAHPTSPRAALAWTEWSLPVDGIEWLNADSQWRDDGPLALLRAAGGYWFRAPQSIASLLARPERALARWDALAAERQVVGLGALDAHANLALGEDDDGYGGLVGLRFPGYESTFRVFALRVELDRPLTGEAVADGAAVIARMRAGRTYTAVDALAGPVGFAYTGTTADGGRVRMGERAPPERDLTLNVTLSRRLPMPGSGSFATVGKWPGRRGPRWRIPCRGMTDPRHTAWRSCCREERGRRCPGSSAIPSTRASRSTPPPGRNGAVRRLSRPVIPGAWSGAPTPRPA